MDRVVESNSDLDGEITRWHYPVAAFYSALGIILLVLSFMKPGGTVGNIGVSGVRSLSYGIKRGF